ncbi:MAG: hypothetical protein U0805_04755 [Pirellulales bacterium]
MSWLWSRARRALLSGGALGWLVVAMLLAQLGANSALAQRRAGARAAGRPTAKAANATKSDTSKPNLAPKADDATTAEAGDAKAKDIGQDWVRMKYDAAGEPLAMQTAVVRYTGTPAGGKKPVEVDLIGAVHIADAGYYDKLNERFKQYDVLLYELVAPEGTVVERGRGTSNMHPIGAMQNMAKDVLELDHQLEDIDYTKPNFVHADMSPEDFQKAMAERNDSFLQMYFRLIGQAMAQQSEMAAKGQSSDFDLISALFATDRARRIKIVLGKQLSDMESLMISFGGDDGSAIITDRNKKALEVLKQQIAEGKKKIGIFYGAGHLADMDKRLRSDFNLQPESITWLTAWDLAAKK